MEKIGSEISWSYFNQIDIRLGTIIRAEEFPEAQKPAYKLWLDFGPLGVKKSSAQIVKHYSVSELPGKQVVCIINLGEKQIGNFISQVLVTGFADEHGDVILANVDKRVPNGAKLF